MTYGAYAGLVSIVFFLILHYSGLSGTNGVFQWLGYVPFAVFIFLGTRQFRDQFLGGYIRYGKALASGVLISLFCGVLLAFFMYFFMKVIDTDQKMMSMIREQNEQAMLDRNMSEEEIEKTLEISAQFLTPGFIAVMSVIGYVFFGFLISLFTSFFLKKEDDSFEGFIKSQEL